MTGVCARVDVVVDVVDGVLCRENPLARQFSPADLFTASSSDSSSSWGALEVVKGVVRSASSSEEAVVGLKRKGRGDGLGADGRSGEWATCVRSLG